MTPAWLRLVPGAVGVWAVLVVPNYPPAVSWPMLAQIPLEAPVVLLLVTLVGVTPVTVLFAVALVLITLLKLADLAMFTAFNRPVDPLLDLGLVSAGINLLRDSTSPALAALAVGAASAAAVGLLVFLVWGLRAWQVAGRRMTGRGRLGTACLTVVLAGWSLADTAHRLDALDLAQSPPGSSHTSWLLVRRAKTMQQTAARLREFREIAEADDLAGTPGLLGRIRDRDVLIIFIESYGRASFDNPLYSPTHLRTLRAGEAALRDAGFDMRSGWLTAPTAGGQSWLSHATLANGMWTPENGTYRALLASARKSLFHIARDAGFRTNAVMPAITMAWPESDAMGFDQILAAADLPYAGAPFNWVTMPDQYTLATYQALLGHDPRPDFTQIVLISSHAPWVPVAPVLPWSEVGDGRVFDQWATSGPTPKQVWRDRDLVRDQYRKAVDYSLAVALQHIARQGSDAPVVLLLGDHQPAGFVAESDSADVAAHLIAPPEVIADIETWGWTAGLVPDRDSPAWRMDAFRDAFLRAFSDERVAGSAW